MCRGCDRMPAHARIYAGTARCMQSNVSANAVADYSYVCTHGHTFQGIGHCCLMSTDAICFTLSLLQHKHAHLCVCECAVLARISLVTMFIYARTHMDAPTCLDECRCQASHCRISNAGDSTYYGACFSFHPQVGWATSMHTCAPANVQSLHASALSQCSSTHAHTWTGVVLPQRAWMNVDAK